MVTMMMRKRFQLQHVYHVKLHHPLSFYIIPFLLLISRQQQLQQHGVDGFSRSIVKLPAVTFSGSSSSSSFNGNVIQSRSSRTTTGTSTRRARTTRSRMSMSMSMSLSLSNMMGILPAAANTERLFQLTETLAPKVGILTSTVLYLAPATAVWEAIQRAKQKKKKSHNNNNTNDNDTTRRLLSDLNPLPIALMPMVAVSWFVYGLVSSDPYIILSNCVGSFLSIAYLIGILPLMKYNTITTATTTTTTTNNNNNTNSGTATTSSSNNNNSNNHLLFWTHTTILLSTATTLGVWALLGFMTSSATETLSLGASSAMVQTSGVVDEVLGMYASLLFILLCGSPLSTIQHVVATKNSSSILGRFTLAQCLNTTLWSVYGLAVKDRFVYGPNCIGLGLGLIQLALKIIFPASRRGRPPSSSSTTSTTPVTA